MGKEIKMKEVGTFNCGHTGENPRNMGRGKARALRLEMHYRHKCLECSRAHAIAKAKTYTDLNAHPLIGERLEELTQRLLEKVEHYFKYHST